MGKQKAKGSNEQGEPTVTLNSSIKVGGKLAWKFISVGHTNLLVKVELTWVFP